MSKSFKCLSYKCALLLLVTAFLIQLSHAVTDGDDIQDITHDPVRNPIKQEGTVVIALLVRNKAHILPFFLSYLDKLSYPKNRIALWIRCDHSIDNSASILRQWLNQEADSYHLVNIEIDESKSAYSDQTSECHWSDQRFERIISLRQEALEFARKSWADFVFFVDVDVILVNPHTLTDLIEQDRTVVSPLLNCTSSEWYSNFWGGIDEHGYYKRTPDYEPILRRHWQGCFQVANVHTAFLINLRHQDSTLHSFTNPPPGYTGSRDDVIIFVHVAMYYEIALHVLNTDFYGYVQIPMQEMNTLDQEVEQFVHTKIEAIIYASPFEKLSYIDLPPIPKDTLGFDQVYMVNLLRRPDRRKKMLAVFDELGIQAQIVDAVDGQMLNDSYLEKLGIKMLDGYADPYLGRVLTMGEIGCFLSHHFIWTDMADNDYSTALVFEDDLRFEPFFRTKLSRVMQEVAEHNYDWDLIYLGRKRLNAKAETYLSELLVFPHYSYWTLSYLLSASGARKLLNQNPLKKLIPVDEFLPVMFDRHPEDQWKAAFSPRDLQALSAQPLLIYPTHYTGEPGYITDTEDSDVIQAPVTSQNEDDVTTMTSADYAEVGDNRGNREKREQYGINGDFEKFDEEMDIKRGDTGFDKDEL